MRWPLALLFVAGPALADAPRARATAKPRQRDDVARARAALAAIDGSPAPRTAPEHRASAPADDRARAALAVIDGATWVSSHLPARDGYLVRRPEHAFGAHHVIAHLERTIAEVRALYPDVHTLAIGDISSEHGGKLAHHLSHRTGLDVDVGFYFHRMPAGYPGQFAAADGDLDLEATWALLTAFARTADLADGVEMMFLDYSVQRRLYAWAAARGTRERELAALLQYPRGTDAPALIRHWPNHADHVHVRFKAGR